MTHTTPTQAATVLTALVEEIGRHAAQVASTGEMAPSTTLMDAIKAVEIALSTPALLGASVGEPSEAHEKEVADLIAQRDHREEIIDALCDAVLGVERTEWSSAYYFEDAVHEVNERMEWIKQRLDNRASSSAQAVGWQPIETAPKDWGSTLFDVWSDGQRVADCWWGTATYDEARPRTVGVVTQVGYDSNGPVHGLVRGATHWLQIPPAPAPGAQIAQAKGGA